MKCYNKTFFFILLLVIMLLSFTVLVSCDKHEEYTIHFMVDGTIYDKVTTSGMCNIPFPTDPQKDEYIFDGWYYDGGSWTNCFLEHSYSTNYLNEDVYVYAKFIKAPTEPKSYTVTFDPTISGENIPPIVVKQGDYFQNLPYLHRPGYTYNWMLDDEIIDEYQYIDITEDVTLKAVWTPLNYTISYDPNGGIVDTYTQIVEFDSQITLLSPTREGYTFVYWFSDKTIFKNGIWQTPDNVQLKAKWFKGNARFDENYNLVSFDYGEYPQTIKESNVTITGPANDKGYYEGSDGAYYARIAEAMPRENYTFSNGETIVQNNEYYFKVEPITWHMFKLDGDTYIAISQLLLDSSHFYSLQNMRNDIYPNNYYYSTIREYLNNTFYNKAFTTGEQSNIITYEIDNSPASTGSNPNEYACNNTNDKLFLLSYSEINNDIYSSIKITNGTDYAKAKGLEIFKENQNNSNWFLRSPSTITEDGVWNAWAVDSNGDTFSQYVTYGGAGVRPAFVLKLNQI